MKLDFLVIGAQKSATTALFKYLQFHPRLMLPAGKELPLFNNPVSDDDVADFMSEMYQRDDSRLKGKVTPQYMCDDRIPARICSHNPDIKLIAVLRNPIARAWSHYRMNKRRETEDRDFETAMIDALRPANLAKGRSGSAPTHDRCFESESDYYLAWGEYGRILERYTEYFSPKQIMVVYTEELQRNPAQVLDNVLSFLGLPVGYRPKCLGEVVHKGGSEKIFSSEVVHAVRDFWPVKHLWQRVSAKHQGVIRYWFEQLNVRQVDEVMFLGDETRSRLESHFAGDAKKLAELTNTCPTWGC